MRSARLNGRHIVAVGRPDWLPALAVMEFVAALWLAAALLRLLQGL